MVKFNNLSLTKMLCLVSLVLMNWNSLSAKPLTINLTATKKHQTLEIEASFPRQKNLCLSPGDLNKPFADEIQFYKLEKYLQFAPPMKTQSSDIIKRSSHSYKIILKKKPRFEQTSLHQQWVLNGELPSPINCHTGERLEHKFKLKSKLKNTGLRLLANGDIFIIFIEGMKNLNQEFYNFKMNFWYSNPSTKKLLNSIIGPLTNLSKISTKDHSLNIIESDFRIPNIADEIIVFNTTNSKASRDAQNLTLNISEWNLLYVIVDKWLTKEFPHLKKIDFLRIGLNEFFTGVLLAEVEDGNNLFKKDRKGNRIFDMSFHNITNLLTANYSRNRTTKNINDLNNLKDKSLQRGLRVALAFRSLILNYPPEKIITSLQHTFSKISDNKNDFEKHFINAFSSNFSTSEEFVKNVLRFWFFTDKLPDLVIKDLTNLSKDDSQITKFFIDHNYIHGQKINIKIENDSGTEIRKIDLRKKNDAYTIESSAGVGDVFVNYGSLLYESNKFNNRTGFNEVMFFPGSAKRLYDQHYLVAWIPTLSREPSKPLLFGITGAGFKYLWSRIFFGFELTEDLSLSSFSVSYQKSNILPFTDLNLSSSKNDYGVKSINIDIKGRGTWGFLENLSTTLSNQIYLENNDLFRSFAIAGSYSKNFDKLDFGLTYSVESASERFEKIKRRLNIEIKPTSRVLIALRIFSGGITINKPEDELATRGLIEKFGFYPYELSEARVRLDDNTISSQPFINSISSDLKFPINYFSGGSGLITNRLRGRLFFDTAQSSSDSYFEALGTGVDIPIGGDVVGGGTMVFSNFSMLVGLRQKSNNLVKLGAYYTFSFTGNL